MRPVLLIAEQANPEWVSVPLVGWKLATAIARRVPALIVTHVRNKEAFGRAGLRESRDFVCVDNESIAAPLHRLGSFLRGGDNKGWTTVTALESLSYYAFEIALWRQLGDRIRAGEFSVVHRITPLSPTAPSILARRIANLGVPFMAGPLNGGLPWPPGFESRRIAEREWLSYVRNLYRLLPGYRGLRRHSRRLLIGSRATLDQIPSSYRSRCELMPENGVDEAAVQGFRAAPTHERLRVLFVGRLVPYKCPDLLIEAARTLISAGRIELTVIGDGPLMTDLRKRIDEYGLSDRARLLGWLSHTEVLRQMTEHDVLVLPSIREFGGGVVLEAMSQGLPAIVANHGGPAELIDAETGIAVDFTDAATLTSGLQVALEQLSDDRKRIAQMSQAAIRKVRERYTWQAKAERIEQIYTEILG